MKLKTGDERHDGMVFLEYSKIHKGGERWVSKEKLNEIRWKKRTANKVRRQKNKDFINEQRRIRYKTDSSYREKIKLASKINYAKTKPTKEQKIAKNQKAVLRRKQSPIRAIKHRLRCYLCKVCKSKAFNTEKILGCSFDDFLIHIENQFDFGMSWENRSEWHIDHIKPLACAKTKKEVLKLFHYTNLRPLWAKENLQKSYKYENKH